MQMKIISVLSRLFIPNHSMLDLLSEKCLTVPLHQISSKDKLVRNSPLTVSSPLMASPQTVLSQGVFGILSLLFLSALSLPQRFFKWQQCHRYMAPRVGHCLANTDVGRG